MGLTPLQGLVMGTRSGDVDPGLHAYLAREAGLSLDEIDTRAQQEVRGARAQRGQRLPRARAAAGAGDADARLAFDVVVHRLKHYVGAYLAILGGIDVLVFTAGVGENSVAAAGRRHRGPRASSGSRSTARATPPGPSRPASSRPTGPRVVVAVVPTNEELAIARQTADLVG